MGANSRKFYSLKIYIWGSLLKISFTNTIQICRNYFNITKEMGENIEDTYHYFYR